MTAAPFLARERTVAPPGFNRWLVPPAALAVHLAIGQIYAYSVFNKPLASLIGGAQPAPGDWSIPTVGWIFSIALLFLGAASALFGKWVERVGPRRTMFTSALLFCSGFVVAAMGVYTHQIWLLYLGNGVLGGIGLGLGYISPVSTLIKWFPDRPGLATGLAIMGFGGGALIASPLSVALMNTFKGGGYNGVPQTFLVLAAVYLVYMLLGALLIRVPAEEWRPEGFVARASTNAMITSANVLADQAVRTPQFWLLFAVLCLNVTAGIGILGQAAVMIQDFFSAQSVGAQRAISAGAAAGFVGLLSLFNMAGRFVWSSLSDSIGRKNTYSVFFLLGALLFFLLPRFGDAGDIVLFVTSAAVIISMYGGGFATIPAYLRDLFGTKQVGAIHGRLLLAWSAAGVLGPVLVNYIRQYELDRGVPAQDAYNTSLHIMAVLLLIGFVCNMLVRPVNPRYHEHAAVADTPMLPRNPEVRS